MQKALTKQCQHVHHFYAEIFRLNSDDLRNFIKYAGSKK